MNSTRVQLARETSILEQELKLFKKNINANSEDYLPVRVVA